MKDIYNRFSIRNRAKITKENRQLNLFYQNDNFRKISKDKLEEQEKGNEFTRNTQIRKL